MALIVSLATLQARLGRELAVTAWTTVSQAAIDRFAEATGDDQWIHTDPARAASSPWGSTIAHGFYTLSQLAEWLAEAVEIEPAAAAINYGLNRVRFVTPVPAGGRIRARFSPAAVDEVRDGLQVVWAVTIDLEGAAKPACVAEWIVRYLR